MFTNTKAGYVRDGKVLTESACLSTDTKPTTGIANGSCLIEMDTGNRFMFDEAGSQWLNITNPGGGGGDAEVWLVSSEYVDRNGMRWFVLSNAGDADHMAELYNNGGNYQVFLNGVELPYFTAPTEENNTAIWEDTATVSEAIPNFYIEKSVDDEYSATAVYVDASTAPTSAEVSVKAK